MLLLLYKSGSGGVSGNLSAIVQSGAGGKRHRRRKIIIGDRIIEVREQDIPALLESLLTDEPVPLPRQAKKAAKRAIQATKRAVSMEQPAECVSPVEARFMALLREFASAPDLTELLVAAQSRMIELDDEEVLLLI